MRTFMRIHSTRSCAQVTGRTARPSGPSPTIGHDRRSVARLGPHRHRARRPRIRRRLLGLDALGHPRPRPRALRVRPCQRRVGRPQPDHPTLLPPTRLRPSREACLRDLVGRRGRGRRADRHRHRRPGPLAGRSGDPHGRLHREPDRGTGAVRDPRRRGDPAALAAVAARRRHDRDVAGAGWPGRPVQGQCGASPAGDGARRHAHRPDARHGDPRGRRRDRGRRPAARPIEPAGSSSPPTPGRTSSSPPSTGGSR